MFSSYKIDILDEFRREFVIRIMTELWNMQNTTFQSYLTDAQRREILNMLMTVLFSVGDESPMYYYTSFSKNAGPLIKYIKQHNPSLFKDLNPFYTQTRNLYNGE